MIIPEGVVGTGFSTASDHVDIVMTGLVPRGTPTIGSWLLVCVQATGDPAIGFGGGVYSAVITDNAPEQPCYSTLYGSGNRWDTSVSAPIAGDLSSMPPSDFSWSQMFAGVILHDLNPGDKITITYGSSATAGVMKSIRAVAFWVTGIKVTNPPFHFTGPSDGSGWTQARSLAQNQFEPSQPAACFDGSLDSASITPPDHLFVTKDVESDEASGGTNSWTQAWNFATVCYVSSYQPGVSSFSFANPDITEEFSWFEDGDANSFFVFGCGNLRAAPIDGTKFGGCFNTTPDVVSPAFPSVHPRIWEPGAGLPYDNPADCGRGVILSERMKAFDHRGG